MNDEDIYLNMRTLMDFFEEEYQKMFEAKTNKNAIIYDNNPDKSKCIPQGGSVEIIGQKIDDKYIPVRYRGYNHLVETDDLIFYNSQIL